MFYNIYIFFIKLLIILINDMVAYLYWIGFNLQVMHIQIVACFYLVIL